MAAGKVVAELFVFGAELDEQLVDVESLVLLLETRIDIVEGDETADLSCRRGGSSRSFLVNALDRSLKKGGLEFQAQLLRWNPVRIQLFP